ncbi:MAG: hypothetical protein FJ295_18985 [Planctomycetes bacterium]|nr:hypothetical protein [Planctomycetota bacterium]
MIIHTTRFGNVEFQADDILTLPKGLVGYETEQYWVLLADEDNESIAWLQQVARPELAMAVVSPRRFVPDYNLHVSSRQLELLQLSPEASPYVLVVLSRNADQLTINLRAPILLNLQQRLGRQLLTLDEQPLQLAVARVDARFKQTA